MKTSIFEIFKIGIGPSSSHTVGPMRAARRFGLDLQERGWLGDPHNCQQKAIVGHQTLARVRVELFGSLALTGHGHQTDRAVLLGLSGEEPDKVDPASIEEKSRRHSKATGATTSELE